MSIEAVVVEKCDCCCPQAEGDCCLPQQYAQAVISVNLVNAPFAGDICDCANGVIVFDLEDEADQFEIQCENTFFGDPVRVTVSVRRPFGCVGTVDNVGNVLPGIYTYRWSPLGDPFVLALEYSQLGQFPDGRPNISQISFYSFLVATVHEREVCRYKSRPLLTCDEYAASIPTTTGAPGSPGGLSICTDQSVDEGVTIALQ